MHKTTKEQKESNGDVDKYVNWSFPISEIRPQSLDIKLGYTHNKDGTDLVYVKINGLQHPKTSIPHSGPTYIGKQTKDPILYALSKQLLDAFENEAKSSITFSHVAQQEMRRGAVIEKHYDHGMDESFFRLENWAWTNPRYFSSEDANTLFSTLEAKIDQMVPTIESSVAECAKNRPALMQGQDPVPLTMHREMAALAGVDAEFDRVNQRA